MIVSNFFINNQEKITSFEIKGHSYSAESGKDIICAAVSSAVYMAVNTITDVLGLSPLVSICKDGLFVFKLDSKDTKLDLCQFILRGLFLHLTSLEDQYSTFIEVNRLEV